MESYSQDKADFIQYFSNCKCKCAKLDTPERSYLNNLLILHCVSLGGGMTGRRPVLLFITWVGTDFMCWSVIQLACHRLSVTALFKRSTSYFSTTA